jgi:tRNA pseudouridine32 synthase/23S rRNA pseudouridine746 synthase
VLASSARIFGGLSTASLFLPLAVAPPPSALPARLPNPFAPGPPHPLAREAAERLQRDLAQLPTAQREDLARGKMMGVLVARDAAGRVGVLRAFAGMLAGRWDVDGFVGPVFDLAARNALWPTVERELRDFEAALEALPSAPHAAALRAQLESLVATHAPAAQALNARHEARHEARTVERAALSSGPATAESRAALARLARQHRDDRVEGGRLRAAHVAERELVEQALRDCERDRDALARRRADRSNEVLEQLLSGYQLPNARGEVRSVRDLFAPHAPAGGAGDCAGPKLFAHAQRERLQPIALAEFWWGEASKGGGQRPGVYYPSCRSKCGPVLGHMLEGWAVDELTSEGG